MSLAAVLETLGSRGVANPERLAGELLAAFVAPIAEKYDQDKQLSDIGAGVFVSRLRAATKPPASQRRDAKLAYVNAQGRYRKWTDTFYDWPEGWVIRACFRLEQEGKELCSAALKKELPPSPLEVAPHTELPPVQNA